ncbi:MAG: PAS domain-containing protein [Oscillospiraceae bacterium]
MKSSDRELCYRVISESLMIRTVEPGLPCRYVGQSMLDFFGYASQEELLQDIDGKAENYIHPDDIQFVTERLRQQLSDAGKYIIEYRIRKKDGDYLRVQDRGKCLDTGDGKMLVLCTYSDCSKHVEKGISDELKLYSNIVHQATNCVYVIERDSHKLLYVNSAMEKMLARSGIHDCLGKKCYCALRDQDKPCEECLAYSTADTIEPREVYINALSRYYSIASHSINWRGVPAYVIYLSDISEEKKANNEIARIYNNIPGAVFRCRVDSDWTVTSANDGMYEFFGYTREEFSAMGNRMSAVIHPDDFSFVFSAATAQIDAGKVSIEDELRILCKDKSVKWILLRGQLIESEDDGKLFYCVFVDITEKKKATFELAKTQQKLAAAIDHAGLAYLEYDIARDRAYLNSVSTAEYSLNEVIENYPEALYKTGAIHADSIAMCDAMIKAVKNGDPTARADIKTIDAQGNLVWKRVRFTTLFDENEKPFWAVATAESINDYKALENRFSTVLEQNHIDTWLYDMSRCTIIQNHNTEDVYGVHAAEIPNVPETLIEKKLCYADDAENFREFYRRLHRGENQVSVTVRLWNVNSQSYIWKRCTYTVLPSKDGNPSFALGSAVDVTDQIEVRQKYEDAIKYRYRTLGENVILAGHCNVTRNVILEIEDKTGLDLEQRFGMVREDFFQGVASLIPDEKQQQIFCKIFGNENTKNSFELGITQHDFDCTIDMGEGKGVRWISTHVDTALQPETNELIGFLTVTDVSANKMQEQVLDSVIQFDYDFVAHLNLHSNTTVFYNSRIQATQLNDYKYGVAYSYTDAIRNTANLYIVDEDKKLYAEKMSIENVMLQLRDKDSYEFIYHLRETNGDICTKQTRFVMHDRASGIVVFSRADVTDMLAQQEKQKIALSESLAIAQQANSSKSKFLSSMSHDIRTPMNAIVGMCSLAIADEHNQQQVHESLKVIEQSSSLLLSMITDILDMNRIESGKMILTCETFSISEQLNLAAGRARALASKKHQTIELSVDIIHDTCSGDVVRIHRVIDNILANALKFTHEGGEIRYCLTETELSHKQIGLYRFEISDNGIGISAEQQLHIFEPFYRVQNTMISQIEGTGLGLSIVKSIVDYMGGTISVRSVVGDGTTFVIELPLRFTDDVIAAKKSEKKQTHSADFSGLHVLLCEDHPMNQLVATRILKKSGADVSVANNGQIGYEMFFQSKEGEFDVILMDVQMPVKNGYEATCAIRECSHPQSKTIPIIAMTANAFAEDVQKSLDAGMNDHLAKPIEPKQIYDTLAKFIC